jgi:hypothetical protein
MFRKLISNLAFSPALVGQLGFYAKRLRKEEATRRIGLIFTALALIVQSFAVFSPPEAANAASPSDFIRGGVSSIQEYVSYYDRNSNNIKDIFSSLGITRNEIASAQPGTINSKQGILSWGMVSPFSAAQGDRTYTYQTSAGATGAVHYHPLRLWDSKPYTLKYGSTYQAYIGHSEKFGWFALMKACGNLNTMKAPPQPTPPPPPPSVVPAAACTILKAIISNRTIVELTGEATVSGGARVKEYTFAVKNSAGTTIATKTVTSSSSSAAADNIVLDSPGKYSAELAVQTTEGTKTAPACATTFSIAEVAVCSYTPTLPANSPQCQPCASDLSLWIGDDRCGKSTVKTSSPSIVQTKTASNLTQNNVDATTVTALPSDRIAYQVTVKNSGDGPVTTPIKEQLNDVLEYASIIDGGGGSFDKSTQTLSWPNVTLEAGQQQSRVFVVQLASTIPAMAQGTSNPTSYDCIMTNTFGNTVAVNVNCPTPKVIEQTVTELPHTGAGANMIFAGIVLSVVTFFYARSRQLKTEVRLIRRDLNAGTI